MFPCIIFESAIVLGYKSNFRWSISRFLSQFCPESTGAQCPKQTPGRDSGGAAVPAGAWVEGLYRNQPDLYRSSKIFEAVRGYINLNISSTPGFFLPSSSPPHSLTFHTFFCVSVSVRRAHCSLGLACEHASDRGVDFDVARSSAIYPAAYPRERWSTLPDPRRLLTWSL